MGAILRNLLSELWEMSMSAPKDWFENKYLNRTSDNSGCEEMVDGLCHRTNTGLLRLWA